jgi:ABC-type multidrug transport system ATPase subunit
MVTSQPLLEVEDLKKRFGSVAAVAGVSFSVPVGTCFGLLGPNGAGKTTTIEMIEGIIAPSARARSATRAPPAVRPSARRSASNFSRPACWPF